MKFETGENYEKLVQVVFQSILNQGDVLNVVVQRDVILQGKHSSHQVDIYWRFALDHVEYETIVEVKDWKDAVEQGEVFKFKSVLEDLPG